MPMLPFEPARALLISAALASACGSWASTSDPQPHSSGGKSDSFGPDDRTTVSQSADPRAADWAESVAILTAYPLDRRVPTLEERFDLCEDEPFLDAPFIGHCTAFLVGPGVLATAAHCLDQHPCARTRVVFGVNDIEWNIPPDVDEDAVFQCVGVHRNDAADVALIELDREVPRSAMAMGFAQQGRAVALIGHGVGSSATVDLSGVIDRVEDRTIRTSLDTFSGHSGSPVISIETGEVVGIHTHGAGSSITHLADRQCHVFSECAPGIEEADACLATASRTSELPFASAGLSCPGDLCG